MWQGRGNVEKYNGDRWFGDDAQREPPYYCNKGGNVIIAVIANDRNRKVRDKNRKRGRIDGG